MRAVEAADTRPEAVNFSTDGSTGTPTNMPNWNYPRNISLYLLSRRHPSRCYLVSPTNRSTRILLKYLTVGQLIKKLIVFYGTRTFTIVFTEAPYWTISWARPIHFTLSPPVSLRTVLSSDWNFVSYLPCACYMPHQSHPPDLITIITIGEEYNL